MKVFSLYLLNFEVDKMIFLVTFIVSDTDYGHMMAISQIFYGHYLGYIWVRCEKQFFL